MKSLLDRVDWAQPWLEPYVGIAALLHEAAPHAGSVHGLLGAASARCRGAGMPGPRVRFVAADELPKGEPYECFIARTSSVPTRDNLHDLLNGLVWLRYPEVKWQLNECQAAGMAAKGPAGGRRGAVRDALTLFDENAAGLQAPAALASALAARDWQALFVTHRHAWRQARLVLFGHALLEKLCAPRPAIVAHAWLVDPSRTIDQAALAELVPARLRARPHVPLPVLGVPGWWAGNADPTFYADAVVFRPRR